jgi:colanic acid/amylovoran biosynthesis glycosyltransferase
LVHPLTPPTAHAHPIVRIAYLTGRYPAISHSFILREVLALRRLGVDVRTMSIWAPAPEHLLSPADRDEAARTYYALPPRLREIVAANLRALWPAPRRYVDTLAYALRLGTGGPRHRLRQLFHFAEAVLFWRQCLRDGVRHVHAHFNSNSADAAMLVARIGGDGWSWSFTIHGSAEFSRPEASFIREKIRTARFVVCVSEHGRAQLEARVPPSEWPKLRLVRSGIDPREYAGRPAAGVPDRRGLHVLNVGRLVPLKNQAILIPAIAELRRRGVPARLTIVGDGPERETLMALVRDSELADHVALVGNVGQHHIGAHYASADVFCLPSLSEGLPVVLLEAMAMELPIVATRVAGVPELIAHGENGLLVDPGDHEALIAALEDLASNAARRAEMGREGRKTVLSGFLLERSASQLRALFAAPEEHADLDRIRPDDAARQTDRAARGSA